MLIRVSMEGERDDIQFYFGRTFRTLFRTERDMTRQITDKVRSELFTQIDVIHGLILSLAICVYSPYFIPRRAQEYSLERKYIIISNESIQPYGFDWNTACWGSNIGP